MNLSSLKPAKGSVRPNTRLGRGQGSGGGGTAKRGNNGAKSRSGYSQKRGFEGGQMPLQRRVPKFGFNNINRVAYKAINLDALQALIDKTGAKVIDLGLMYNNGLISKGDLVKILSRGELKSAVEVKANGFSATAKEAIEKAGGSVVIEGGSKAPVAETSKVAKVTKTAKVVETVKIVAPTVAVAVETPVVAVVAPVVVKVTPIVVEEEIVKKSTKADAGDDLKKIEGIGPKIAELLVNAGIVTFADLAASTVDAIKAILSEGGSQFNSHDPETWSAQAALARDGKWDELKTWQDALNGGKAE